MQRILAKKTVSLTDLRDPKKVLEFAGNEPVAVMNRNKLVGYFTPVESVTPDISYATKEEINSLKSELKEQYEDTLEYLRDK